MNVAAALQFRVDDAKSLFFDRPAVIRRVQKGKLKVFMRFGSYVRRDARGLLRPRKRPTNPGEPPAVVRGLIKQFVFFVYDAQADSVVTGPALLNASDRSILPVTEFGGEAKRRFRVLVRGRDGKLHPLRKGQKVDKTTTTKIVRGRKRARIVQKVDVSDKFVVRTSNRAPEQEVKYAPHPFMRPAFDKNLPKVPGMWRDIL